MSNTLTSAELKSFLRMGRLTDSMLKKAIETSQLDGEELVRERLITREKLEELFRITPEEHLANLYNDKYSPDKIKELLVKGALSKSDITMYHEQKIKLGKYSDDVIKNLINTGELDFDSLVAKKIISQQHIDDILEVPMPFLDIGGFDSWEAMPPLLPNRVDVFVLGIAGSGKSSFMAGLLHYARKNGNLTQEIDNLSGFTYVMAITDAVKRGILPPATADEKMQYMACSFRSKTNELVPMTFIEMSGEIFKRTFGKRREEMPANFVNYISHENSKVVMLAVDFKVHTEYHNDTFTQGARFEFIIKFLDAQGALNNTRAICILITKWDLSPDQSGAAAVRFLEEEYLALYRLCQDMSAKYNLKFEVYTYSLGKFSRRNSFEYNPKDSEFIYNWLCSFVPLQRKQNNTSFFRKLFN